jgi:hypothetical protein
MVRKPGFKKSAKRINRGIPFKSLEFLRLSSAFVRLQPLTTVLSTNRFSSVFSLIVFDFSRNILAVLSAAPETVSHFRPPS